MKTILLSQRPAKWAPFFVLAIVLSGLMTGLSSCVGARFDQTALDYATTLGNQLPALMQKATASYTQHETEITAVLKSLDEAHSHAAATKKNGEIAKQWSILSDSLVKPFFARWKEKGKLDKDFIKPAATQVKDSLASIERAERAKPK